MFQGFQRACWIGLCALGGIVLAAPALATPQFTPTVGTRLHTLGVGPGSEWNTGANGAAGGEVEFTNSTGRLDVTGQLDVLNYFDPANGSCATDAGSNCIEGFTTNLDLSVVADLVDLEVTFLGGTFFQVDANFGTTGGTDILITDPLDGDSIQLSGSWTSGTFAGEATDGLRARSIYDSATGSVISGPTVVGFAVLDPGTPFASMFENGGSGDPIYLDLGTLFNFDPSLDSLVAGIIATGELGDFTADAQGNVFRVADGDFVIPEPGTGLLLGLGLLGLGAGGRRRAHRE